MVSCSFCETKANGTYYGSSMCDECRGRICFLCSEISKTVQFKEKCPSHEIGSPFKGNRFMEDKAFMAGGPFEFEPE